MSLRDSEDGIPTNNLDTNNARDMSQDKLKKGKEEACLIGSLRLVCVLLGIFGRSNMFDGRSFTRFISKRRFVFKSQGKYIFLHTVCMAMP